MSAVYFAMPGVNWSSLKVIDTSPLAYKYALENKREDTADLAAGRLLHTLVFEPAKFGAEYAVWEGGDRRGNAWKEFEAANAGRTIFKPSEIEAVRAMAAAVRRHPLVRPYLEAKDGEFERVVTWTDPATGLDCKMKADWIIPSQLTLIDLKSTRSIERRRFIGDVAKFDYYGQLAHYSQGCTHGLKWTPIKRVLIAVEKLAPHDVGVFVLDDEACEIGDEHRDELMAKLKACMDTNDWPGRYSEEQTIDLPGWVHGADDLSITFDEE